MNELLHRDYVPSELKLVAIDESIIEQEVKWKTFGETANSWETAASFNNPETIRKYWARIRDYELHEKKRQAQSNSTAKDSIKKRKRDNDNDSASSSKKRNTTSH
ncbi:hypothetical protein [Parasitella parasitica]|uniref:Chromo domain-containing protein n=1 Tax=Parasitella parasitica TaxID=35722 RepID=A0A0B7N2K3_9FUNG|nr:hypothetical protein [Parasitella parasitica]